MTERRRPPRDIWKEPPRGSEGDAAKDFEKRESPPEHEQSKAPKASGKSVV